MDIESRLKEKVDQRIKKSSSRSLQLPEQTQIHKQTHKNDTSSTKEGASNFSSTSASTSTSTSKTAHNSKYLLDFSSNDYLGLAHSQTQHQLVEAKYRTYTTKYPVSNHPHLGSTGSRLLSGNSPLALSLEIFLARVHNRPSALLFNSGYDANLSLLSSLLLEEDVVIMDELVHNSLIMGVRMSRIPKEHSRRQVLYFRHNDVKDLGHILSSLERKGANARKGCIFVVVESVYSMDGDISPLCEILDLAEIHNASVIVDEAHGLGIYGRTNHQDMDTTEINLIDNFNTETKCNTNGEMDDEKGTGKVHDKDIPCGGTGVLAALELERHPALLAGVFTFGKAAGCHGAVITGTKILIDYLVNYARPFIYSTSLPSHSLWAIKCAYDTMISKEGGLLREKVYYLVNLFRSLFLKGLRLGKGNSNNVHLEDYLLASPTPIQAVLCRGNNNCIRMANMLREESLMVYPIRSPTVAKGGERIRIIIHAHNTEAEVRLMVNCILKYIIGGRKENDDVSLTEDIFFTASKL